MADGGRASGTMMNGAQALVETLLAGGVDVCFTNPGTSEMHFVAALDESLGMRCVLALFEGVATGAADGYARMADKPAATLLHLGPGLANGLANIHNARRARSPMVNIVGDHATYHVKYDAPLTSDVEATARPFSHWVRTSLSPNAIPLDGAAAISAARRAPGQIATLILPANTAWSPVTELNRAHPTVPEPLSVTADDIDAAADTLRREGSETVILIGGRALRTDTLEQLGRIATATGATLLANTSNARVERGAGRVTVGRVPYVVDMAVEALARFRRAIIIGGNDPVGFFAYPGKPSRMLPPGCAVQVLATGEHDIPTALDGLAQGLGVSGAPVPHQDYAPTQKPTGAITPESIAAAVAATLPENAIVTDESITTGRAFFPATAGAHPHSWLQLTGGAIGEGLCLGVGAAIACPDRKVISLQADGSAMYTNQALWTQAREGLDVVTVLFNNRSYAILQHEMRNVGAREPGAKARDMLELDRPAIDWVGLARSMGVAAGFAETAEDLTREIERGLAEPGPYLVDCRM